MRKILLSNRSARQRLQKQIKRVVYSFYCSSCGSNLWYSTIFSLLLYVLSPPPTFTPLSAIMRNYVGGGIWYSTNQVANCENNSMFSKSPVTTKQYKIFGKTKTFDGDTHFPCSCYFLAIHEQGSYVSNVPGWF